MTHVELLENCLESGQREAFFKYFNDMTGSVKLTMYKYGNLAAEVYFSLARLILSFLNKYGLVSEVPADLYINQLSILNEEYNWDDYG